MNIWLKTMKQKQQLGVTSLPIYNYTCQDCQLTYFIKHSIDDSPPVCPQCDSHEVKKNLKTLKGPSNKKDPVGSVVEKFIKDSAIDLQLQRESFRDRDE